MSRITMWLFVGVVGWGVVSCTITCPDGSLCSDSSTCCKTHDGYACCKYPNAMCCADLTHCCPSGYRCNLATQTCDKRDQPWMNVPMLDKVAAEEPSAPVLPISPLQEADSSLVPDRAQETDSSVVYCDNLHYCPDGTTCCRHPQGVWFCCPYTLGRCCLDGYHCCPRGYDCDLTYTHCVRRGLPYPFSPRQALPSVPASHISTLEDKGRVQETPMTALTETSGSAPEAGNIRCDAKVYCPPGKTCCKSPTGQWGCCPYPLGQCCSDGLHCCEYGYTCDPSSMACRNLYSQIPSGEKEPAKQD
ncbi:progranulin-like [Centroberyx affinis]|uniref:progranulin-like n=1 Tax=Centroberyx affinis TaxID=166261 RepID=UPI003A5BE5F7